MAARSCRTFSRNPRTRHFCLKRYTILLPYLLFQLLGVLALGTETGSPILLAIEPPCAKAGSRQETVLRGIRLSDIAEVMCRDARVKCLSIGEIKVLPSVGNAPEKNEVRIELEFAADLPTGNVALHVRTRSGISNPRTLHINRFPIVAESSATAKRETAPLIPMGRTVWGHIIGPETDCYAVELAKGQRCSLEVLGYRLSPTDLDAVLEVWGPDGRLVKKQDTSQLYYHDPVNSFIAPEAGRYLIALRDTLNGSHQNDARYGMSSDCLYAMHVGDYPQPTSVFPLGGEMGKEIEVEMRGDVKGRIRQTVKLSARPTFDFAPMDAASRSWIFDQPDRLLPDEGKSLGTGPLFIMASPEPSLREIAKHGSKETAQALPQPPFAVEGCIEKAEEEDWYRFRLPKGKSWRVDVFARRLRSPMDPKLTLYPTAKAGSTHENDDRSGYDMDSTLIAKGDDEDVIVRVTDTRGEGGSDFGYRLVVNEARSQLNLTSAAVETITLLSLFKTGHSISVPRGRHGLLLLEMQSDGAQASETLEISITDLPPGVKAKVSKLPVAKGYYPVVLSADTDAALGGSFAKPAGQINGQPSAVVPFAQRLGMVYSHPAYTAWHTERFSSVPVAVVDALPYAISIAPISGGVEAGKKVTLKLTVTRLPGSSPQPLCAMFPALPPGVVHGTLEIPAEANEASAELEIPASCPPGEWPIAVVVCDSDAAHLRNQHWPYFHVDNQNQKLAVQGHHWTCAPLTYLRVLPPAKK